MIAQATLLLRLSGPMQSWGIQSRFTNRDTGREPSKSGVVGLICAALGRPRWEPVDDLAGLGLGVRVDFPGTVRSDFHTAGGNQRDQRAYGVALVTGSRPRPVLSYRAYLSGAEFLIGLDGDAALLERVQRALDDPQWPVFLGRKAFVPGAPINLPGGLRTDTSLDDALRSEPWPLPGTPLPRQAIRPDRLRLALEIADPAVGDVRNDQPIGAAFDTRRFAQRYVKTDFLILGEHVPIREEEN